MNGPVPDPAIFFFRKVERKLRNTVMKNGIAARFPKGALDHSHIFNALNVEREYLSTARIQWIWDQPLNELKKKSLEDVAVSFYVDVTIILVLTFFLIDFESVVRNSFTF
jgi:hypothetical protein